MNTIQKANPITMILKAIFSALTFGIFRALTTFKAVVNIFLELANMVFSQARSQRAFGFILVICIGLFGFFSHVSASISAYKSGGVWHYTYKNGMGSSYNSFGTNHYSDSYGWTGTSYNSFGTTHYNYYHPLYGSLYGTSYDSFGTTHYNFSNGLNGTKYNSFGTDHYNIGGKITNCYRSFNVYRCY